MTSFDLLFMHLRCNVPMTMQIRMLGEEGGKDVNGMQEHGDDVFLKKIESHLLTQVTHQCNSLYCASNMYITFAAWRVQLAQFAGIAIGPWFDSNLHGFKHML